MIVDSETGNPLENAIVFLANTPIGTSSASDGTFRIAFVPVGAFQMVIARVGYTRELKNLEVTKSESLYYQIKLQPQPVRTKEVEIVGRRAESGLRLGGFIFPKESPDSYCLYSGAVSQPIGILFTENALYMYALEPAVIDSEKYIRVWLLYQNLSQSRYQFDPQKCLMLHMKGHKRTYSNIVPLPPQSIDSLQVKDDKESVTSKYGKILELAASLHHKYRKERLHFAPWVVISAESDGNFDPRAAGVPQLPEMLSPTSIYTVFVKSTNDGILMSHIVDPGGSFNGYVYFPFPGLNWKATASGFPEATEYVYTIEIITQNGSKFIEFVPH